MPALVLVAPGSHRSGLDLLDLANFTRLPILGPGDPFQNPIQRAAG